MNAIERFNRDQYVRRAWVEIREACLLAAIIGFLLAIYAGIG